MAETIKMKLEAVRTLRNMVDQQKLENQVRDYIQTGPIYLIRNGYI